MTRNSQFQAGSGAFKCAACGRKTRHTGVQSVGSELCSEDYELAGIYNVHQDGGDLAPYASEIRNLCAAIVEKGGTLDSDAEELLSLIALDPVKRLREAAKHVVESWESGDLASAVRELSDALDATEETA